MLVMGSRPDSDMVGRVDSMDSMSKSELLEGIIWRCLCC